ncbi:hypothetical protein [Sphingobacterium bovistauri]|uniref:Uncharacterized protein n=1 Tax=Sphingobacterium bovistauri TaxID=2781959 RepID=A0ABS7ZAB4_9SPHI|nr:hypothetical protein [Sphingobacterium bovistauri]MCA5005654.1 hypothetical protein [Sphingobacterium bovistauri]
MKKSNLIAGVTVFSLILGIFYIVKASNSNIDAPISNMNYLNQTWYFQGGDPTNPDHYSDQPIPNKPCGETEEVICQISAPDSLGKPRMSAIVPDTSPSQTVLQQINEATNNLTPNETALSFREE